MFYIYKSKYHIPCRNLPRTDVRHGIGDEICNEIVWEKARPRSAFPTLAEALEELLHCTSYIERVNRAWEIEECFIADGDIETEACDENYDKVIDVIAYAQWQHEKALRDVWDRIYSRMDKVLLEEARNEMSTFYTNRDLMVAYMEKDEDFRYDLPLSEREIEMLEELFFEGNEANIMLLREEYKKATAEYISMVTDTPKEELLVDWYDVYVEIMRRLKTELPMDICTPICIPQIKIVHDRCVSCAEANICKRENCPLRRKEEK